MLRRAPSQLRSSNSTLQSQTQLHACPCVQNPTVTLHTWHIRVTQVIRDFFLNCDWIRVSDSCPYNAQMPNSHILHRKKLEARGTWFIKDKHRVLAELTPELCSPCPLTTVGRLLLIHMLFSSPSDRTAASQQMTKVNEQFMSRNKTHWIKHTFNCRDPGLFVPRLRGTGEGRAAHGETLAQLPPSALSSSAATVLLPVSQSESPTLQSQLCNKSVHSYSVPESSH